ncbi:MAG: hypothetical protein JXB50_06915 [Spirochaetes bacterium]|nr:hypothetical protein [Spirochaetota bacterium]
MSIKKIARIINNLKEKPVVRYGTNPAYNPKEDYIIMPAIKYFKSSESYFFTLWHELIHFSGHEMMLNRFNSKSLKFASGDYAKEKLIAELGSSFLCHLTGIEKEIIKNQASYIKDWLEVLNNDKRLIITASSQAQMAVDYILSVCNSAVNQATDIEPFKKAS